MTCLAQFLETLTFELAFPIPDLNDFIELLAKIFIGLDEEDDANETLPILFGV